MIRRAFTLIELLVVVAIMIALFTIAIPGMRALLRSGDTERAVTMIEAAVSSTRTLTGQPPTTPFGEGEYQGAALIFTPANELRMVKHDPFVKNGGIYLYRTPGRPDRAGYVDVDREYFLLPASVGVVGLMKNPANGQNTFVPPPFAIRFGPEGHMLASSVDRNPGAGASIDPIGVVTYDGDQDGDYSDTSRWNGGVWEPTEYDPQSADYDIAKAFDPASQRQLFPWDELDAVLVVYVYERQAFLDAGNTYAKGNGAWLNDAARQWIEENGEYVFFNRNIGTRIRVEE